MTYAWLDPAERPGLLPFHRHGPSGPFRDRKIAQLGRLRPEPHFLGCRALQWSGSVSSVPLAGDDRATPATVCFPNRRCHAAGGVVHRRGTARLRGAGPDGGACADAAPRRPAHGAGRDPKRGPGNTSRPSAGCRSGEPFPSDGPPGSATRGRQSGRHRPTSINRSGTDRITPGKRHDAGDPSSGRPGRRPARCAEIAYLQARGDMGGLTPLFGWIRAGVLVASGAPAQSATPERTYRSSTIRLALDQTTARARQR